jgi:hypothetical protein
LSPPSASDCPIQTPASRKVALVDGQQFDDLVRTLSYSRRWLLGLGTALGLAPFHADAKRRKKKKKKKNKTSPCQPQCSGRTCGADGCGGSCGGCSGEFVCTAGTCRCPAGESTCGAGCCGACQACADARQICVMEPGSDGAICTGGACCGGACCPPACQCGVSGLSEALAAFVAEFLDLPYPVCVAPGTGQMCGIGGSACPTGTTCEPVGGGVAVCVGRCPGVEYPALPDA